MTIKYKLKIIADIAMIALLPFLMAYSLIGETLHEWLGTVMLLFLLLHHTLNYRRIAIGKGRCTIRRIIGTALDMLLLLDMISLMGSGIILSKSMFSFLNISKGVAFARTLHLLGSYWGLVLMPVHLGLHWGILVRMLGKMMNISKPSAEISVVPRIIFGLISIYGIHALISRKVIEYMLLKTQFVFFDFSEPLALFLVDHTAIMMLFAAIGYIISIFMQEHRKSTDLA